MANLLLLSEIFPPANGGSGRWFGMVYPHLREHQACCLVGSHEGWREYDRKFVQNTILRYDLTMQDRSPASLASAKRYLSFIRLTRSVAREQSINQIHAARPLFEGLVAKAVSLVTGIPYICYVHGEDISVANTSRELRLVTRQVLTGAKRIIANSHFTQDMLREEWAFDTDKVRVIHPGVDTTFFKPASACVRTRQKLGWDNRAVTLTVGRLQPRKGHDNFIRALPMIRAMVPDILYAIVGGGPDIERLQRLAAELGVEDSIRFHGEVSDQVMLECYQQCDLFCLPNRAEGADVEGFGMVSIEAQACGKIALVGNSGGAPETVLPGQTGFAIDCTSPEIISQHVIDLVEDPKLRRARGDRCRERAVKDFDWSSVIEKSESLFTDVQNQCFP